MARVLCAWEFGGDLGHIRRLTALADALRESGHDPALAFSNLGHAGATSRGFRCYQAPLTYLVDNIDSSPLSLAHVLLQVGFRDGASLVAPLRAWLSLIRLEKPDIIVGDYAPLAFLAARLAGLPRVLVGSGFSSPPRVFPLPALRPWEGPDPAQLKAFDSAVTTSANAALTVLGGKPILNASDLFDARDDILCTFAELDPLGTREGADYLGPLDDVMPGAAVEWPDERRPRIFAYLKPRFEGFKSLLDSMARTQGSVIVAVPGLTPAEAQALCTPNMQVVPRAVTLPPLLASCDLCICHAGPGLIAKALAAGVPLGLLPMHLEQLLISKRMQALGVAEFIAPIASATAAPDFGPWVPRLLMKGDLRAAAGRMRERFSHHRPREAAAKAAARVTAALAA